MAKPLTDLGLAMVATTKLDDPAIMELAAQAAGAARTGVGWQTTWANVRIDRVKPGALCLSVRGPGGSPVQLVFVLEATPCGEDSLTVLRTRITSYRTTQDTLYGFIPVGPKRMAGLPNYQKFLTAFCTSLCAADPAAAIIPESHAGRQCHDTPATHAAAIHGGPSVRLAGVEAAQTPRSPPELSTFERKQDRQWHSVARNTGNSNLPAELERYSTITEHDRRGIPR